MGKATPQGSITIWGRTFPPGTSTDMILAWMEAQPEYPLLLKLRDIYLSLNEQGRKWALQVLDALEAADGGGPNVTALIPPPPYNPFRPKKPLAPITDIRKGRGKPRR